MLFMFPGIVAAEGNVADFGDEFLDFPFLRDVQFAIFDFFAEFPCREGAAEDDVLRILGDVDEAAAASDTRTEFGYVDVAVFVTFSQAQAGQVQTAAIVEVELGSLVHISFGIDRSTEADAAEGNAADSPGFDSHGQAVADAFFVSNRRNEFRNTDTQVDDGFIAHVEEQESCPAGNDFLGIERSRIEGFDRNRRFPGQGRIVFAIKGLLPFRFIIDLDDIVDIDARYFDQFRVERAAFDDFFDLDDDDTAAVMDGLCQRRSIERRYFLAHDDVAPFIGISPADEADIHIHARIEELVMAFDVDDFDKIFLGDVIEAAATDAGVGKGIEADVGNRA